MKRKGKRWNNEEIGFLKTNYAEMSNKELARNLERNVNAIKAKATELNLSNLRRRKPDFGLEEWQKAYLAGLIDGEGWIGFRTQAAYPQATVRIANKDPRLSEIRNWFKNESSLYKEKGQNDYGYLKISFHKQTTILSLLEDVMPFLIFKKEQAKLVTQYIKSRLDKPKNRPISEKEWEMAKKCHELNQELRGVEIVET